MPTPRSVSRVDLLPVELLSLIFLLGYDDGIDPARPFKRREIESETNFEVLVSHVCRRWRSVAHNTPALWTSIRLRKPSHLERGAIYVRLSRNAPLDILLDTVAHADYLPGLNLGIKEFKQGFDVAIEHTHRWRSLIVKVYDLPCKDAARRSLRDCPPIPKLETLQLYHVQEWSDAANMFSATTKPPIPILNDDVPNLLNASLIGVNLAYKQTSYLAGLRHLELALHSEGCRPTSDEFEHILRDCPDLERLSLHYSGPRVDGTHSGPAIRLEKLTELSLANMDVDVVAHVFRRVNMPNLRLLELELPELQDGLDFTPVIEWIGMPQAPAFPILERLCIGALACSVSAWTSWLTTLPLIRHLELAFGAGRMHEDMFTPLLETIPADVSASAATAANTALASSDLPNPSPSPISPSFSSHDLVHPASPPASPLSPPSEPSSTTVGEPRTRDAILLPNLESLQIAGIRSRYLCDFATFRSKAGYGVPKFFVHIKSVDEDTDELEKEHCVKYYGVDEVEDDDDGEDDEEEDGEYGSMEEEGYSDEEGEGVDDSAGETHIGEDDKYTHGCDDKDAVYDDNNDDAGDDDDGLDDDDDSDRTQAGSIEYDDRVKPPHHPYTGFYNAKAPAIF